MKKSFAMVYTISFILFISFVMTFVIKISSYSPRIMKDLTLYTQGKILLHDAKELSKYFLHQAYLEGKECLNEYNFEYNNIKIRIDYAYPLGECKGYKLIANDANAKSIIAVNISVLLNDNKAVNEEVFLQKSFFVYPKLDWM
ncbi:hypothetical protein F5R70_00425 [Campylobacter lari]|uniref:Periplasmic protein n=1 Tax=Campylobacter lari TaxID=201 RepID=A0A698FQQ6_CAMLA|nr:hypothetical protein [Campylobacter lari]ECW8953913.1 hypothetical protein [Campylobacter lari]MBT0793585.1 hypothetical protein [Campylobacter lari]MCR6510232.1 hypothetical protein [Campylobacter lari]MCR6527128.1 hypothetical protein [Campylobacter lari]MCR6556499.1 hypothetical protein [Campylobacter lari]